VSSPFSSRSTSGREVVDYTKEDFSRAGQVYDMVAETVGTAGYSRCLKSLKRGGPLVLITISGGLFSILGEILRQQWISITGAAKIVGGVPLIASRGSGFSQGPYRGRRA
jgi:NADPH:quinone reductase-like Zn-dependent oxidoreductase